jgi:hypothetical protein
MPPLSTRVQVTLTDEQYKALQALARLVVDQVAGEVLPVTLEDMGRAFDLMERYGAAIESRDAVHAA